ncbi:PEP-CTERM sorting domain-containing protein [Rhodopirellula islandica]|uniref:PEP-CTERM sorting domain-containing protein n=1 Tax=Rhodopirellula islandica TaxID=595434 RepID=UPI001364C226|nr:PEP-CTERM sorting domain-containing protein [Rhodopirellula islandica]
MTVTNFSWIGVYTDSPTGLGSTGADSFTVRVYSDGFNATEGRAEPSTLLTSSTFTPGEANETAIDSTVFSYSADFSPFAVTANEQYWFSVVANMNADDDQLDEFDVLLPVNEWGVVMSGIGDGESIQNFQTAANTITPFFDDFDYAFSVTAVPEPATGLALLMFGGGAAAYRRVRRSSRKNVANAAV